jgi:hypothetical protein
MAKRSKRSAGLADPTHLPSFDTQDKELTVVIIENAQRQPQ